MTIINDPDLYARMAEPYASKEDADEGLAKFQAGVRRLREECRIAEVMVASAAHYLDGERHMLACDFATCGKTGYAAILSAMAYREFAVPEIERAQKLQRLAGTENDDG